MPDIAVPDTTPLETAPLDARSVGERIEQLLDASASAGPIVRERSEELVRLVVELYGAGLERLLELMYDAGALTDDALESLAGDDLVASLLLVHDLHPYPVEERVGRALDRVRPYMGTHGGDVELIEVTDEGVARLRMLGSCDGCASSAVTLDLAVKDAVEAAAPEIVRIEVVEDKPEQAVARGVIPVESLTARLHVGDGGDRGDRAGPSRWEPIGRVADLPTAPLSSLTVGGLAVIVCRVGDALFAYRDGCAACGSALGGATIEKRLGQSGSAVLTCPGCRAHFDVRRAGAGIDDETLHLDPLPLLDRDGVIEIAMPSGVAA
jgi:Fe-S cluster biogenesis protein NfuA/nitrite reductase/ring-hydroxylating ferredoxin subunit